MLASGKFPRFAAILAVLAPLLLAVDILFFRPQNRALFVSNSLDFFIVALAAISSFYVARHCVGFARQLWILLGVALTLEACGQALTTYYQTFQPSSLVSAIPSDIFFFVWAAPVFMIFLPRSEHEDPTSTFDWLRILDFLQVAIVALTMYLYFFYSPSRWMGGQFSLVRTILVTYVARDLLLAIGFFLRYRSSILSWFRSFALVLAIVFITAAAADTEFFLTFRPGAHGASWGDFFWALPYVILVLFAVCWKSPHSGAIVFPPSRVADFFAQQFLPIGLPLLVIVMAQAIAHDHFLLSWITVIISVICSSVRLILTNRKTRRVAGDLLATEKALRISEQMLSTAFRSSPDAFSINVFPNGPYLEINEGFTRLTGFTRAETLNRTPSDLKMWIDREKRIRVVEQLTRDGYVRDFEFTFRNKAGQIRVGLMSASLIEVDSRQCSLVMVRDITDRKEAEDILRTSEERFRSLVENLHVGIVIYGPDARIVFANSTVLSRLSLAPEQFIGKTSNELGFTAIREDGSPLPQNLYPVALAISTRQPVRNLLVGWLAPRRTEPFWTLLDAVPEFSSTSELVRVVVSFTDITEQRRAAEALRESEERFRTLVTDLQIAVVLFRPDSRIEYGNAAAYRMFGIPEGTAIGKLPDEDYGVSVCSEDGVPLGLEDRPVPTALRTRKPVPGRLYGIRRAGSDKTVWVFGNAIPQLDSNGNLIRVINSLADVTEMKNAERAIHNLSTQLVRLQDEERRRIGRELHDGLAQTVLAINLSLAQVRQSLTSQDHAASRSLEKARSLTQQMSREIRTLSYLLHPPLLDDLGLVSALREYAHGFGERSSIDTQLEVLSDFTRLPQALELALFRVVQESLANIQRHSGSATALIRLLQDGPLVTLEVIDHGCGIAAPVSVSAAKPARLGVGIPGMRERISQLGGRLDILSNPDGTTVRATVSLSALPSLEPIPDATTTV